MKTVKERDGAFRWTYLDKKLEDILEPIGVTVDEFIKICDEFTNKKLFLTDKNGKLIKDKNGNLTKINYDNVRGREQINGNCDYRLWNGKPVVCTARI